MRDPVVQAGRLCRSRLAVSLGTIDSILAHSDPTCSRCIASEKILGKHLFDSPEYALEKRVAVHELRAGISDGHLSPEELGTLTSVFHSAQLIGKARCVSVACGLYHV